MSKMKVKKVIDGDTFVTQDTTNIRLANVRAPEKGQRGPNYFQFPAISLPSDRQCFLYVVANHCKIPGL